MKGDNPLGAFWDRCFGEGIFMPLEGQPDLLYDSAYVGVMLDWDRGDGDYSYIVGMLMKAGADVPEGYFSRLIPATRAAIGWIQGKDTADVCSNAHQLTEQTLKEKGYTCDTMRWCMELYGCPRFTEPDENGEIVLDYYIPVD